MHYHKVKLFLAALSLIGAITLTPSVCYAAGQTNPSVIQQTDDDYINATEMSVRDETHNAQILITADLPTGFTHTCYADIRCLEKDQVYRFLLYPSNGYRAYAFVETGTYSVLSIGVVDDTTGLYEFTLPELFTLSDGEAAELTTSLINEEVVKAKITERRNDQMGHPDDAASTGEPDEGEIADTIDEENANDTENQDSEQGSQTPRAIAVAVILAIITLAGLFSFRYYMLAQIPDPNSVYRIHAWAGQTESLKKRR